MSMLNKWNYDKVGDVCYADPKQESYKKAAEFLGDTVEDWGCGTSWARKFFKNYRGIDGSKHKNNDIHADLTNYTSSTDNILMREVLEYNTNWKQILSNVKKSFKKKFCLIISTPFADTTHISYTSPNGVQEHQFKKEDILNEFPESHFIIEEESIKTNHLYNQDNIFYITRK